MALKNSQYYAIMREYEQKQLKSRDIQNARYEEVYKNSQSLSRWTSPYPFSPSSTVKSYWMGRHGLWIH